MEAGEGHRDAEKRPDMEKNSKKMFRSGQADTELLDRTVLRVLEAKFRMGLFEHPFAMDGESCQKIFEEKEGAELSFRSARESMVLLKKQRDTSFVR